MCARVFVVVAVCFWGRNVFFSWGSASGECGEEHSVV